MLAIGDGEAFYDLYCNISNRAIDMYVKAGRRKFALKLHTCLAALDKYVPTFKLSYLTLNWLQSPWAAFQRTYHFFFAPSPLCTTYVDFPRVAHAL